VNPSVNSASILVCHGFCPTCPHLSTFSLGSVDTGPSLHDNLCFARPRQSLTTASLNYVSRASFPQVKPDPMLEHRLPSIRFAFTSTCDSCYQVMCAPFGYILSQSAPGPISPKDRLATHRTTQSRLYSLERHFGHHLIAADTWPRSKGPPFSGVNLLMVRSGLSIVKDHENAERCRNGVGLKLVEDGHAILSTYPFPTMCSISTKSKLRLVQRKGPAGYYHLQVPFLTVQSIRSMEGNRHHSHPRGCGC
jgi:hypothetical protein